MFLLPFVTAVDDGACCFSGLAGAVTMREGRHVLFVSYSPRSPARTSFCEPPVASPLVPELPIRVFSRVALRNLHLFGIVRDVSAMSPPLKAVGRVSLGGVRAPASAGADTRAVRRRRTALLQKVPRFHSLRRHLRRRFLHFFQPKSLAAKISGVGDCVPSGSTHHRVMTDQKQRPSRG